MDVIALSETASHPTPLSSESWYQAHAGIPTRCRVPAAVLANRLFQRDPFPVEIEWGREEYGGFFAMLAGMEQHISRQTEEGEVVEFNALSSFSTDREVAWEFGSTVWRVEVPMAKMLLIPGILPPQLLQGEQEVLVLGGNYLVQPLPY